MQCPQPDTEAASMSNASQLSQIQYYRATDGIQQVICEIQKCQPITQIVSCSSSSKTAKEPEQPNKVFESVCIDAVAGDELAQSKQFITFGSVLPEECLESVAQTGAEVEAKAER